MKSDKIAMLLTQFESLVHHEQGIEFWFARELQPLLGYSKWDNFEQVVAKARDACRNAGHPVGDHFADVGKMVDLGSGAHGSDPHVCITNPSVPTYQGRSACVGGPRAGASSGAAVGNPIAASTRSIETGSWIAASSLLAPRQCGHTSTSTSQTRRSSSAHG